ncbi:MAG TPA: hypothetical protein VGE02_15795 [Gemmatimonadales bacterium]
MPPTSRVPLLGALVLIPALLSVNTLHAQATTPEESTQRASLLLAGGAAGQFDGDRDLGSAGLHLAFGVRVPTRGTLAIRAEVQGFEYGPTAIPLIVGARGPADRLGALAALAEWAPGRSGRVYLLGGVGVLHAGVAGASSVTTGAGMLGAGLQLRPRVSLETQYLHPARDLGLTRSVVTARLQVRL